MTLRHAALAFALTLSLAACANTQGGERDLGRGDEGSWTRPLSVLEFGGEASAEFVRDLEIHSYAFVVSAGDAATIEVTQKGSSRGLDTTLFLFGPSDEEGVFPDTALLLDRDSGYGTLSKIAGWVAPASGTYLAVVANVSGGGPGRYRIVLSCDLEDGSCGSETGAGGDGAGGIGDCVVGGDGCDGVGGTVVERFEGEVPGLGDLCITYVDSPGGGAYLQGLYGFIDHNAFCEFHDSVSVDQEVFVETRRLWVVFDADKLDALSELQSAEYYEIW